MTVYTRTDKRFHRAHLKPTRRRRLAARRRLAVRLVAGILGVAAATYWLADAARRAPLLRIDTITVDGNRRLSDGEALTLVAMLRGQNLLVADLDAGRASLLTSGWVREATLRRVLPSTIEITVEEREPVGLGRFGAQLYLVDETGRIVDAFGPRFADLDLPIIDGLAAEGPGPAATVDERRASLAARLIAEVGAHPQLATRVSQVDVGDPYNAVVLLSGDPALLHLGAEAFVERLQTYLELAPTLRTRVPEVDYVDLRFDRRVYVRPAGREVMAGAEPTQ